MSCGFTLFDTAIGRCGVAWRDDVLVAVQLPEATDRQARDRLLRRAPDARELDPPAMITAAMAAITALLRGEPIDLSSIPLAMDDLPPFHRRVYDVARTIGPGSTLTYGEVARRLGDAGAARAVGQALGRNPFPIVVPCHRVLAAGGRSGGFSAHGGVATKRRLLAIEAGQPVLS